MENMHDLRAELVSYIKRKFYTRQNIPDMADDIVNRAFLDVAKSAEHHESKYNFGYMRTACLRTAYKVFHKNDKDTAHMASMEQTAPMVDEYSFVEEIEQAEDAAFILQSLQTLKDIERIIVKERYYGSFTFKEISESHGINLNTVLSHHRRALEKLRPAFAKHFDYQPPSNYYKEEL